MNLKLQFFPLHLYTFAWKVIYCLFGKKWAKAGIECHCFFFVIYHEPMWRKDCFSFSFIFVCCFYHFLLTLAHSQLLPSCFYHSCFSFFCFSVLISDHTKRPGQQLFTQVWQQKWWDWQHNPNISDIMFPLCLHTCGKWEQAYLWFMKCWKSCFIKSQAVFFNLFKACNVECSVLQLSQESGGLKDQLYTSTNQRNQWIIQALQDQEKEKNGWRG